jgi:hypothetical protein
MKKIKGRTCGECPNRFECTLLKYNYATTEAVCLIMKVPVDYSPLVSHTKGPLIIPEDFLTWRERLTGFIEECQN